MYKEKLLPYMYGSLVCLFLFLIFSQTVSGASFSDTFRVDTSGNYTISDVFPWETNGQFVYDISRERVQVTTGDQIGLEFSHPLPPLDKGSFKIDFLPTQKYPNGGQVFIWLLQDTNNYYLLYNKDGYNPGGLRKVFNGNVVKSVSFEKEYQQNTAYSIFIAFTPDSTVVDAFDQVLNIDNTGAQSIVVNELRIQVVQQNAYFDNIFFSNDPYVRIIQPQRRHFQSKPNLTVKSVAEHLQRGWGVRFILDLSHKDEVIFDDYSFPYETTFLDLKKKEHTVNAFIIDASGDELPGPNNWDHKTRIGIGDYYVALGDSNTVGVGDDDDSDNLSQDRRNNGGGYVPILNDALTRAKGYPHTIMNEGVGGEDSIEGLGRLQSVLSSHPQAQYFLIMYGTNDSGFYFLKSGSGLERGDPGYAGSFKDNIQHMITMIRANKKIPFLAKAPIAYGSSSRKDPFADPFSAAKNIRIQEYNQVIDTLVTKNGIRVVPPDFYSYFEKNPQQYSDNLHMNGNGYQSMAAVWLDALTH